MGLSADQRNILLCLFASLLLWSSLLQQSQLSPRLSSLGTLIRFPTEASAEESPQASPSPITVAAGNMPRGAVAVVFVGTVRSFAHEGMRRTIVANVHDTLRASGYSLHTFFHVDKPEELSPRVLHPFQPATVTKFYNPVCPPKLPGCPNVPIKGLVLPWVLCRMREAWPIVLGAERMMGQKFEWIYRLRPDLAFPRPLPVPATLDIGAVHVNTHIPGTSERGFPYIREMLKDDRGELLRDRMGDHMAIVARPLAETLFRAIESYDNCHLRAINFTLNPEVGMAYWLARNSVRVQVHQWFWLLVRQKWGPECGRVQYLGSNVDETRSRVEECNRIVKEWGYTPKPPRK